MRQHACITSLAACLFSVSFLSVGAFLLLGKGDGGEGGLAAARCDASCGSPNRSRKRARERLTGHDGAVVEGEGVRVKEEPLSRVLPPVPVHVKEVESEDRADDAAEERLHCRVHVHAVLDAGRRHRVRLLAHLGVLGLAQDLRIELEKVEQRDKDEVEDERASRDGEVQLRVLIQVVVDHALDMARHVGWWGGSRATGRDQRVGAATRKAKG